MEINLLQKHEENKIDFSNLHKSILKLNPSNPESNYYLGIQNFQSENFKNACFYFESSFNEDPTNADYLSYYINTLIKLKNFDKAENIANVLKENKNNEKLKKILDRYTSYVRKNKRKKYNFQNPNPQEIKLITNFYQQKNFKTAIEKCNELSVKYPNSIELFNMKGIIYSSLNQFDNALEAFFNILKINSKLPEVHNNIGSTFHKKGDYKLSIEHFIKALEFDPNFFDAYNNIGMAYIKIGQLKQAIECFNKSILIKPNQFNPYYHLGFIYKLNQNWSESFKNFSKSHKINPECVNTHMNLNFVKGKLIPHWHFAMMNDEKRNDAYAKAIRNAVSKDDLVLEIGTGSGLLSMIATENTSEKIFSCETSQNIATVAKEVILENGLSDKIDVINKKSTDLLVGKDIPGKVDVIISEILSAELVGEGVRSSILDAKKRLLKDGGKMIPQSGAIKIALICQNEEINKKTSVQKIIDFDLSAFNNLRADKFSLHLNKKPKLLSDAINAFEIDFQNNFEVQNIEKILKIKAIGNGVCIGLIQWLDINIYKDIKYENTPGVINSHWPTPIYLFKNHIELYEGQVLNVRASLFEDSVWFKMI